MDVGIGLHVQFEESSKGSHSKNRNAVRSPYSDTGEIMGLPMPTRSVQETNLLAPEEENTLHKHKRHIYTTTFDVLTELFRNKVKRFRIVKHRKGTDKLESESTQTTVSFWRA